MISFDEWKDKAVDLTQSGISKARDLSNIAKLNLDCSAEEDTIRKAYIELGKLYYAEHGLTAEGAYVSSCEKITAARQKITDNKAKIAEIRQASQVDDFVVADATTSYQETTVVEPVEVASDFEETGNP